MSKELEKRIKYLEDAVDELYGVIHELQKLIALKRKPKEKNSGIQE